MKPSSKIAAVALLLVGLVLVNYLASALPLRMDLTADDIYTLSEGTENILEEIEDPITVEFYFSRSLKGLNILLKNYASRVQEMLRQYERESGGKMTLVVIDPRPDTAEEERAMAAGLTAQPLPTGETLFFGVVATQADQQRTLPFIDPNRERFLEYDISQLVYSVQQFDRPELGLISGLPMTQGIGITPPGQPPAQTQNMVLFEEWNRVFDVVPMTPMEVALPESLAALAVIHPHQLSPDMLWQIDQFLLSGKPVFIAVDPSSHFFRMRIGPNMFGTQPPEARSDLPDLFSGWGLNYDVSQVVADFENATTVQVQVGSVLQLPIWLSLTADEFSSDFLPVSQLSQMLLVEPGSLSLKEGSALTLTPVLKTSPRTGTVSSASAYNTAPEELMRQIQPKEEALTLAALVQGTFQTAFPQGRPQAEQEEAASSTGEGEPGEAIPAERPPQLMESESTSTLLVVADTDFMTDLFSVERFNFMGHSAARPANDNLAFASNAMEFLSGSRDLISIRGKGSAFRPFEVIRDMEREAQERYQQQLGALEARLTEVQTALSQLRGDNAEGNRLVVPADLEKQIEAYQQQEAAMRAERRDIRKALREDIESLQNRLVVANLLGVPLLIVAFGLFFLVARFRLRRAPAR